MKRILVIRFSSLGDIALTTPVFRNIKEYLPDCRLYMLTKKAYTGLLEGSPYIDGLITLEECGGLSGLIKKIRSLRFDYIIDLHANLRSLLVRLFAGAGKTAVYKKDALARRLFVAFRKSSPALQKHTVDRYLGALEKLHIPAPHKTPEIYFKKPEIGPAIAGRKILFIQTSFLGDIVLSVPALKEIKAKHKDSVLHFLTTPQGRDVLEENGFLDKIIVYDKKSSNRSLLDFFKLSRELKRENYDIAIIPHRSFRSALLAKLSGIKERVGFDNSQGKIFLTKVFPFQWNTHDLERNYLLLKPLGIELRHPEPWLELKDAGSKYAEDLLNSYGVKKGDVVVGINPGSVWETKKWPAENYVKVAAALAANPKVKVLLFGGKNDLYLEETVAFGKDKSGIISLIGRTKINELIQLIGRCALFLTNDSGPMHIAAGLGVPTVGIFGPTTRDLGFFPYGQKHTVIEVDLPCRPCGLHGKKKCPKGHFNCMKMITPEKVLEVLHKKLII